MMRRQPRRSAASRRETLLLVEFATANADCPAMLAMSWPAQAGFAGSRQRSPACRISACPGCVARRSQAVSRLRTIVFRIQRRQRGAHGNVQRPAVLRTRLGRCAANAPMITLLSTTDRQPKRLITSCFSISCNRDCRVALCFRPQCCNRASKVDCCGYRDRISIRKLVRPHRVSASDIRTCSQYLPTSPT